jgi:hypothetical protein
MIRNCLLAAALMLAATFTYFVPMEPSSFVPPQAAHAGGRPAPLYTSHPRGAQPAPAVRPVHGTQQAAA